MASNSSIKGKFFREPNTFLMLAIALVSLLIYHEIAFGDKALAHNTLLESLLQ